MTKGTPSEIAAACCELQDARTRSAQDGYWRVVLTPDNAIGRILKKTLSACGGGSGRTETFTNQGKVSVTSDQILFSDPKAILVRVGWWGNPPYGAAEAWQAHCKGS